MSGLMFMFISLSYTMSKNFLRYSRTSSSSFIFCSVNCFNSGFFHRPFRLVRVFQFLPYILRRVVGFNIDLLLPRRYPISPSCLEYPTLFLLQSSYIACINNKSRDFTLNITPSFLVRIDSIWIFQVSLSLPKGSIRTMFDEAISFHNAVTRRLWL